LYIFVQVKKSIILILAFLYLGITSGVAMNIHYCMGAIASVDYGVDKTDGCGKCGMKDKDGCCHTESILLKISDAHLFSTPVTEMAQALVAPSPILPVYYSPENNTKLLLPFPPDPENSSGVPLHLYYCVFRI